MRYGDKVVIKYSTNVKSRVVFLDNTNGINLFKGAYSMFTLSDKFIKENEVGIEVVNDLNTKVK